MSTSYGDGSWELSIAVVEVGVEKTLRVKGDLHVGGLMVRLVQELGECLFLRRLTINTTVQADCRGLPCPCTPRGPVDSSEHQTTVKRLMCLSDSSDIMWLLQSAVRLEYRSIDRCNPCRSVVCLSALSGLT